MRTSRTIQRIAYDRDVRGFWLLVLAAACTPSGLTIEVVIDDPNIKKVELFAGDPCHPDCPRGTVPPGLPPMAVDDAFIVIDPKPFTVPESEFSDGVAGFRIESATDAQLAILVIVAYDASDQIRWSWSKHWVDIPNGDGERWRVHLTETQPIAAVASAQPAGTERIKDWRDARGHPSCLLLEHWSHEPTPYRELLGPKDDPDCDGVAFASECAPWIPNAVGAPPPVEEASCILFGPHNGGGSVCQLGGPECSENSDLPTDTCVALASPYCAPALLCQCEQRLDYEACMREVVQAATANNTLPFMKCVIAVNDNFERCDSAPLFVDGATLLNGTARKCEALQFADGNVPLGAFGSALHVGEAKLKISNFTAPCKADLYWEPGMAPPLSFGLLDADIDNGYHAVLPVRVEVRQGCAANIASLCTISRPGVAMTGETLFTCIGAPPVMTGTGRCAPDPDQGCLYGPMCNGMCCGYGESCDGGVCRCNNGPRCNTAAGDKCEYAITTPDMCGELCCGPDIGCPF